MTRTRIYLQPHFDFQSSEISTPSRAARAAGKDASDGVFDEKADAMLISTGIFDSVRRLARSMQGFVIVQAVGGVIFAAAYELEKNLLVPITIHCLGDVAIFCLSFIG